MMEKVWQSLLHRSPNTHKYDYGHVLVIGGSQEMAGAAVLAARATLRVGGGLVSIASTEDTVKIIDRDIEEVMTLPLPAWHEVEKCLSIIQTFIKKRHVSVLIIGPGLPRAANKVVRALLVSIKLPTVIDAESFTALDDHLVVLKSATAANKEIVMTPHPGEYSRLIHNQPRYQNDRPDSIKEFARDFGVTMVLKQHPTIVVGADGELYENPTGNPGLATAGSGDVLTGIIAGLMAQEITPYKAAIMGVYLHGLAADIAVKSKTEPGMIASDIIETLPEALQLAAISA